VTVMKYMFDFRSSDFVADAKDMSDVTHIELCIIESLEINYIFRLHNSNSKMLPIATD